MSFIFGNDDYNYPYGHDDYDDGPMFFRHWKTDYEYDHPYEQHSTSCVGGLFHSQNREEILNEYNSCVDHTPKYNEGTKQRSQRKNNKRRTCYKKYPIWTMCSLSKVETDLPVVIWIGCSPNNKHKSPQIKFANNTSNNLRPYNLLPISISEHPTILLQKYKLKISDSQLTEIKQWIIKNKDCLLQVWNAEITPTDFVYNHMVK